MIQPRQVIHTLSSRPGLLKVSMILAMICLPVGSYAIYVVTANGVDGATTVRPQNPLGGLTVTPSQIADAPHTTSAVPAEAEHQPPSETATAPPQVAPMTSPPTVSGAVPEPPKLQGYQPTYPKPQPEVVLSHTSLTLSASATSHTITASMNDASAVHWLGGGRHDYLVVTPGQEETMPVKLIFEHAPGDMIRTTIRFHFVTSYAARPASYGFAIYAHDGVRELDIRKEIYVRVE